MRRLLVFYSFIGATVSGLHVRLRYLTVAPILTTLLLSAFPSYAFYIRTTQDVRLNDAPVPIGSYVYVQYDGGTFWYTSHYRDADHIPKSSGIEVPRFLPSEPTFGVVNRQCSIFPVDPDLALDRKSLTSSSFVTSPPSMSANVRIMYREEDNYVVVFPKNNSDPVDMREDGRRIPVRCVTLSSNIRFAGFRASIPPLPEAGLDSRPMSNKQSEMAGVAIVLAMIVLIGGIAAFIVHSMNRFVRKESIDEERARIRIMPLVEARFPRSLIFRVPDALPKLAKIGKDRDAPLIREIHYDRWEEILNDFPNAPRTESDRLKGEIQFWEKYARRFTLFGSDGKPQLSAQRDILDCFRQWEKWIFREYFAATGVVHETVIKQFCNIILDTHNSYLDDKHKIVKQSGNDPNERRQAIEALKRFEREAAPAHFERWGGWFFLNIQSSFTKQHVKGSGYGPESPVEGIPSGEKAVKWNPET